MKLFHVSDEWTADRLLVYPRICDRVPGESNVPRICVCPSLIQCLLAIGAYYDYLCMTVYQTEAESILAVGVFDIEITEERWITTPTVFQQLFSIPQNVIKSFTSEPALAGLPDEELLQNLRIHRERLGRTLKKYLCV